MPHSTVAAAASATAAAGWQEGLRKMGEGIARIGIISLVSASDGAAPLAPPGMGLRREASGMPTPAAADDDVVRKAGKTAAALELSAIPFAAPLSSAVGAATNQKLLLLAAFLQIGDWEHAQQLMRWLSALGLSDFSIFPAIGQALCEFLSSRRFSLRHVLVPCDIYSHSCTDIISASGMQIGLELAPVYAAATSGEPGAPPPPGALQLSQHLLDLLSSAGQHLYHNVAG